MSERTRAIVKLAADRAKDVFTKDWFLRDERGHWEKSAQKLLDDSASRAAELGMTEEAVNGEVATVLLLTSYTAQRNTRKKR